MKFEQQFDWFQIFESVLHGVILTDLRGRIVFLSRYGEKMLGFNRTELIGKPLSLLYAEEQESTFKDVLKTWVAEKKFCGRLHAKQKDGSAIWLDVKSAILNNSEGEPINCVISVCDIGKLQFTRKRLKKNQAISQAIFDASIDAMVIVDKFGNIRSVNRSMLEMFGYNKNELIGKNISKLTSPSNFNEAGYLLNYLKKTGYKTNGINKEIHGLKNDGTVFPVEISASEVLLNGTGVFAGIIRDLTERRKLERRILNIGNQERIQIGRELHDGLGQMLTGIRMLSEVLYRKLKANALPGAEEVGELSVLVKKADEFTRDLSRNVVQTDLKGSELSRAIANLCKRVSRMSEITCTFHEEGAVIIEQDDVAQHLYRITQESVSNAIKHGGPETITVRLSAKNDHISLIVEDDGKGFDENGPDPSAAGAGLKIMKHRARVLGGNLELCRTKSNRTQMRCIIPANQHHFI